jgi:uncharacterized membrane protein YgcG
VKGQFVYTVPSNFDPDGIGRDGLNEIQDVAKSLHYPYYVVVVDEFDGESDEDAAQAIDTLAADWQKNPIFDVRHSCIFLLSYNPRKYRFLAGTDWKVKLGFEREAHDQYTAMFVEYAKGTPSDPKTGIIEMMKAVDAYLFDQMDPARIAARAEERKRQAEIERKQRIQEQLDMARSSLDNEILRTESLLNSKASYLPGDAESYKSLMLKAREVRRTDAKAQMLNAANSLKSSNDSLDSYIGKQKSEAFKAGAWRFFVILLFFVAIFILGEWIIRYVKLCQKLKLAFYTDLNTWKGKVQNAKDQYFARYYKRDGIITLQDSTGRTKELYDELTSAADAIFLASSAMNNHINIAESMASKSIKNAYSYLLADFEFDTGQINEKELFEKPTKVIKGSLKSFEKDLQERFAQISDKWTELEKASDTILTSAYQVFPVTGFDEIAKIADENGIPHRWLQKHPLAGDDAADKSLYEQLEQLKKTDPIAFLDKIKELEAIQDEVKQTIDKIIAALKQITPRDKEAPPSFGNNIVLNKTNDPITTFSTMERELSELSGVLANAQSEEEIFKQVNEIVELSEKVKTQTIAVQSAITDSPKRLTSVSTEYKSLQELQNKTEVEINKRKNIYQHVDSIYSQFVSARDGLVVVPKAIDHIGDLITDKNFLQASGELTKCEEYLSSIRSQLVQCLGSCNKLDKQKEEYEKKLTEMDDIQAAAVSKINRYGGSPDRIDNLSVPNTHGLIDYAILLTLLNHTEDSWNSEVRSAEQVHLAAVRREEERERAEEQRQAEERRAEQRRRDNDSYSSSSSSSGSSWGGGFSSSSGGSWGGGGSSSSGGSW